MKKYPIILSVIFLITSNCLFGQVTWKLNKDSTVLTMTVGANMPTIKCDKYVYKRLGINVTINSSYLIPIKSADGSAAYYLDDHHRKVTTLIKYHQPDTLPPNDWLWVVSPIDVSKAPQLSKATLDSLNNLFKE